MIIGIPVYEGVNLLDVTGPFEMFSWVDMGANFRPVVISEDGKPVTTVNNLRIEAHYSFADAPHVDALWVPGGDPKALRRIMTDPEPTYLDYIREVAGKAEWVCSVCEGALLAAKAGLLDGFQATTHWQFINCLKEFTEVQVVEGTPRFVHDRNRLTGGGISSGLDESLKLIELIKGRETAERVQRTTQYFPDPPVNACIDKIPACEYDFS